jgi:voltage-gated potassium channel
MNPTEFGFKDKIDPYYFSFTTMSTVGYGDFRPKSRRAKIVVMSQQMILLTANIALFFKYFGN